jgi:hypothetical protein
MSYGMIRIKFSHKVLVLAFSILFHGTGVSAQHGPEERTMLAMVLANKYFMEKWPHVGKTIITDRERNQKITSRWVTILLQTSRISDLVASCLPEAKCTK